MKSTEIIRIGHKLTKYIEQVHICDIQHIFHLVFASVLDFTFIKFPSVLQDQSQINSEQKLT